MVTTAILATFPLFTGLPDAQLEELGRHLRTTTLAAGTPFCRLAQPAETVYLVLEGTIQVATESPAGDRVILAILGQGALIGEMGALEGCGRCATATAMTRTTLIWMPGLELQRWLERSPRLALNLALIMAQRLRLANAQMLSLVSQDVYGRIARMLVTFAREHGSTLPDGSMHIPLRLTQGDLADLVGATRPWVNKVMAHYRNLGYLTVSRDHQVTVHSLEALAQCAGLEPAPVGGVYPLRPQAPPQIARPAA